MELKEANELLPSEPTKSIRNPSRLKYLILTPPKWGKTTFMCGVPNSLLLATEEGHAFHETHKIIIDSWDKHRSDRGLGVDEDGNHHLSFVEAVEAVVSSDKFDFVIIDTVDMAAKMCLDWFYKKFGVTHASEAGDYGKGWDISLTQPFRQQVGQLMHSGRGIGFITHTQTITKKVGREEQTRTETTLPSQVQKFLHTQADVILHGSFGRLRKGMDDRDRVISMDGSNEILAGSRVRGIHLPRKYIVDPNKPWEQWKSFFDDPKAVKAAEDDYVQKVLKGKQAVEEEAEPEPISETPAEVKAQEVPVPKVKKPAQRRGK